jgi:hypothetical protein
MIQGSALIEKIFLIIYSVFGGKKKEMTFFKEHENG